MELRRIISELRSQRDDIDRAIVSLEALESLRGKWQAGRGVTKSAENTQHHAGNTRGAAATGGK